MFKSNIENTDAVHSSTNCCVIAFQADGNLAVNVASMRNVADKRSFVAKHRLTPAMQMEVLLFIAALEQQQVLPLISQLLSLLQAAQGNLRAEGVLPSCKSEGHSLLLDSYDSMMK